MDGILRCSRYSYGPNRLHYCGPDANRELGAYLEHGESDPGLTAMLERFDTLYRYLRLIAHGNNIADPFDDRVVEAYWIGNQLLETISREKIYRALRDDLRLHQRLSGEEFELIVNKLHQGAVPHHSFHVFNIWKRTGHLEQPHTLQSMDDCRISWGTVLAVDGPTITIRTEPLVYRDKNLALGNPIRRTITRQLESEHDIEQLKKGDCLTIHWGVPCEVVTAQQANTLRRYTLRHLALANLAL